MPGTLFRLNAISEAYTNYINLPLFGTITAMSTMHRSWRDLAKGLLGLAGTAVAIACGEAASAQEAGRAFNRLPSLPQNVTSGGVLEASFEPTVSDVTTFATSTSPEVFDTGTVVNAGTQTSGGITATYDFFTAGSGLDTTQFGGSTLNTGDPFPGDTDFTLFAQFSDVNDGNAFTNGLPTTSIETPDTVSLNNYVVHGFSFSEPIDLLDFRVGDLDFDHDDIGGTETDDYHDAIALVVQNPDGTFTSIAAPDAGIGSSIETYEASINADPDFSGNGTLPIPDFSAEGLTDLVPYRNSDNANPGVPPFLPSDDSVAVSYGTVTNISAFYVLYWSERLGTGADAADLQGISLDATFLAASTSVVPFDFSTSALFAGLLPFLSLGIYKRFRRQRTDAVVKDGAG